MLLICTTFLSVSESDQEENAKTPLKRALAIAAWTKGHQSEGSTSDTCTPLSTSQPPSIPSPSTTTSIQCHPYLLSHPAFSPPLPSRSPSPSPALVLKPSDPSPPPHRRNPKTHTHRTTTPPPAGYGVFHRARRRKRKGGRDCGFMGCMAACCLGLWLMLISRILREFLPLYFILFYGFLPLYFILFYG